MSPTATTLLQTVRRTLDRYAMALEGERVLLAVSGGRDSMTMLDIMGRLASALDVEFAVAHLDHGLRGEEGEEDAMFVVEQAARREMRSYVGRADVRRLARERKVSIEEGARMARYAFLSRVARKGKYGTVMTAHTSDDNAETLLLNLLRGAGVRGLAGIPPVRPIAEKVVVARPLLDIDRATIEKYMEAEGLAWREDSSNESAEFTRNRVRHGLIPVLREFNPGVVGTLNTTSAIMRELAIYIDEAVEGVLENVAEIRPGESVQFQVGQLRHLQGAMQGEVVQQGVARAFEIGPLSYAAVSRTLALLDNETGTRAELLGGISAVRDRDLVIVRPDQAPERRAERNFSPGESLTVGSLTIATEIIDRGEIRFSRDPAVEYIDLDSMQSEGFTFRMWREGDRFHPFGMDGEKKVSDYLVDTRVPRDKKSRVGVLLDGDRIVWLCGLRLDDRYKVNPASQRILRLTIERSAEKREGGGNRGGNDRSGNGRSGSDRSGNDRRGNDRGNGGGD